MNRILVVGTNGAGKSTFARKLGEVLKIEVVHLDKLFHQDGWQGMSKDKWLKIVTEIIAKDWWIIDGTYPSTLAIRAKRADTVICFDYPKHIAIYRIVKRYLDYRNKSGKHDRPEGLREKFPFQLILRMLKFDSSRLKERLPKNVTLITVKSDHEVNKILQEFTSKHD